MAENNLLTNTHAGLKSTDFCVNQLTSTTHGIFSGFDSNPSLVVLGVFIELSKAFVRVWHEVILSKLKNSWINGNLLDVIELFLHNRCQSVVTKGQFSN